MGTPDQPVSKTPIKESNNPSSIQCGEQRDAAVAENNTIKEQLLELDSPYPSQESTSTATTSPAQSTSSTNYSNITSTGKTFLLDGKEYRNVSGHLVNTKLILTEAQKEILQYLVPTDRFALNSVPSSCIAQLIQNHRVNPDTANTLTISQIKFLSAFEVVKNFLWSEPPNIEELQKCIANGGSNKIKDRELFFSQ